MKLFEIQSKPRDYVASFAESISVIPEQFITLNDLFEFEAIIQGFLDRLQFNIN